MSSGARRRPGITGVLRRAVSLDLEQRGPNYRRAMDGYRGLFVVLVIAYHFGASFLVGGWIGINHFFVFSGFLIGTILIKERQWYGDIDLLRFYIRRARRIIPALTVLVVAVLLRVWLSDDMLERPRTAGDAVATLTFWLNWKLVARNDLYFDYFSDPSPLRHAWTLAVEEQFYLIVPWLIIALFGVLRTKAQRAWFVLALAAACAVWTAYLAGPGEASSSRLYYSTDIRMQALLVGVAGALMYTAAPGRPKFRLPMRWTNLIGWIGTIVSIAAFFVLDERSLGAFRYGGLLFFAVVAAFMGITALDTRPITVNRIVGVAPLVHLGQISYGLYLFHWPIGLWLPMGDLPRPVAGAVQFLVTWVCAVVCYRLVEAPIMVRGLRGILQRRPPSITAPAILATVAVFGVFLWRALPVTDSPPWNGRPLNAAVAYRTPASPVGVALIGDSIPTSLGDGFVPGRYPGLNLHKLASIGGCNPVPVTLIVLGNDVPEAPSCRSWRQEWPAKVKQAGATAVLAPAGLAFLFPQRVEGRVVAPGSSASRARLTANLDALWVQFERSGARQLQLMNVPCRVLEPSDLGGRGADIVGGRPVPLDSRWANGIIREWAATRPADKVTLFDLDAQLCPQGKYERVMHGAKVYKDGVHFSRPGAELVWSWLAPTAVATARR